MFKKYSPFAPKKLTKIFKIVLSKAFDLKCTIPEISAVGEPIFEYMSVWSFGVALFFYYGITAVLGFSFFTIAIGVGNIGK